MSMDPAMMQQLLTAQLQQRPQTSSFGGGGAGPQMQGSTTPVNAAMQLAQKAMLMKALQTSQQKQQQVAANGMLPQTNAQIQGDPQMQSLRQSPQLQDPSQIQALQQQSLQSIQQPQANIQPTSLTGGTF